MISCNGFLEPISSLNGSVLVGRANPHPYAQDALFYPHAATVRSFSGFSFANGYATIGGTATVDQRADVLFMGASIHIAVRCVYTGDTSVLLSFIVCGVAQLMLHN